MFNPVSGESILQIKQTKGFVFELPDFLKNKKYMTIGNFILIVYVSGILSKLVIFIQDFISVSKIIATHPKKSSYGFYIVELKNHLSTFAFLNYIFLNEDYKTLSDKEKKQVLKHEIVHARQLHSLDIIVFELLCAIYWFNPIVKRIKNSISEVHEYIADSLVAERKQRGDYSRLILKLALKKTGQMIASYFSKSQIKNRLTMLAETESDKLRKLRFIISIPVLLIVLFALSFCKEIIRESYSPRYSQQNAIFFNPLKHNFKIITPFFTNKKLSEIYRNEKWKKNNNSQFKISHPLITYQVQNFTKVFASNAGVIKKVEKLDNWGLMEYHIEIEHNMEFTSIYKGLYKVIVKNGDSIEKDKAIGITGDTNLYPTFSFQLLQNKKPVDPMLFFEAR
jgi:hypothetical protein